MNRRESRIDDVSNPYREPDWWNATDSRSVIEKRYAGHELARRHQDAMEFAACSVVFSVIAIILAAYNERIVVLVVGLLAYAAKLFLWINNRKGLEEQDEHETTLEPEWPPSTETIKAVCFLAALIFVVLIPVALPWLSAALWLGSCLMMPWRVRLPADITTEHADSSPETLRWYQLHTWWIILLALIVLVLLFATMMMVPQKWAGMVQP